MAFVTQDFLRAIDFTALANATAGDHNSLIDITTPYGDKGILLWSVDTALDTPDVPDPTINASYTKFKHYLWLRKPHSTATTTDVIVYAWNDDLALSDPTYLKWIAIVDTAGLQAQINTALANAASAQVTANNANALAGTAAAQAATALTTANAAAATAATASANASSALIDSATAQSTANTALTTAQAAAAPRVPASVLTPGSNGQVVRTGAGGAVEWAYQGIYQRVCKVITGGLVTVDPDDFIPFDNTPPQLNEGKTIITTPFTPKSAASLLRITFSGWFMSDTGPSITVALFTNASADARHAVATGHGGDDENFPLTLDHVMQSPGVSAITFTIQFGPDAGVAYFNRTDGGSKYLTACNSYLIIEEFEGSLA